MCKLTSPIFMNHKQAKILARNVRHLKASKGLALQYGLAKIKIYSKMLVLRGSTGQKSQKKLKKIFLHLHLKYLGKRDLTWILEESAYSASFSALPKSITRLWNIQFVSIFFYK